MGLRKLALLGAALAVGGRRRRQRQRRRAQNEQFIPGPGLPHRRLRAQRHPVRQRRAPTTMHLVNERDGGINGVKIAYEECETAYATDRGVECYERLKGKGPTGAAYVQPAVSTGITFALTEKAPVDKIPLITMGYGRSEVARRQRVRMELPAARHLLVGRRHHHAAHRQEGRRLRQAQGQEDRAGLSRLALRQGADRAARAARQEARLRVHADARSPHPGVEQKATWLQIRQNRPDYVLLWGWGVMNSTSIKEAAAVGFPRDKMFGVWWSGAEPDVRPAEDGAKGYKRRHAAARRRPVRRPRRPQEVPLRQGQGRWRSPTRSARCSTTAA